MPPAPALLVEGARLVIAPPVPVDLRATVGLLRGGGRFRFARDGVWHATRTVDGPATLQLEPREPTDPVVARAWGPGADRALAHVPDLLGFHDDHDGFAPMHPLVIDQHRRHRHLRLGRTRSMSEALLPTIVGQRVPSADALRSWRLLRWTFAEPAPGPADLALPPDPARLARLAYPDLHRFGIERKRAVPFLAACRHAERLQRLVDRTPADLAAGLGQIRGLGEWTATMVARVVIGDADTVVVGDYGIPSIVAWALAGERRADDARMLELLEPERPHRGRALALVMMAGRTPPRHGPRLVSPAIIRGAR
jgi:3-methyladenine DNA glycosylase/8-oxoguanine DNA glycosylase